MTTDTDQGWRREQATEALRAYGHTNAAMGASRTYLVHDAWQKGEKNIKRLAELAGVSRDTIYADLAKYDVEVAEDLNARLARWSTVDDESGRADGQSDYRGFAGNTYGRVWRRQNARGYTEISLVVGTEGRSSGDCYYYGYWDITDYDADGEIIHHESTPMTRRTDRANQAIELGIDSGLSVEQAINRAIQGHIQTITLADLHASYRPQWI
jgi:hypothetical protein